jgi:hypothetical protein
MSQYDFGTINPATKSGTALASDLNSWRSALHSTHGGSSAPSYITAGMLWLDTTSSDYRLKLYDGAQSIDVAIIDATNNVARVAVDSAATSYITSTTAAQIKHVIAGIDTMTVRSTGLQFNITLPEITDSSNNELISFTPAASAVNELRVFNAATGDPVRIGTQGDDANIILQIWPKGESDTRLIAESSVTNAVVVAARVQALSTGTPTAGFGAGLAFMTETAPANNEISARIESVSTDVTAASEDFDLVFKTMTGGAAAAEVARLTSTQYLRMASGTLGIQFNGDTAAANALDDYEEGTWTPVVADAVSGGNVATTSSKAAQYTKIGNLVFVDVQILDINTTGMTAGNTLYIRGLPFTSKNTTNARTHLGADTQSVNSTAGVIRGFVAGNTTTITMREGLTTGGANLTVAAVVSGSGDIWLSGCYIAA